MTNNQRIAELEVMFAENRRVLTEIAVGIFFDKLFREASLWDEIPFE